MTPILILAAGRSSRMAPRDKLAEPVGGVPLLRRQAAAAAATGEPVFVALPGPDHPRAALLEGLDVTALVIPRAAEGMGATLRDGVARLPAAPRFLVLLADLPGIGTEEMASVIAAGAADPGARIWQGTDADGALGHPILFDAALRPAFADLAGDEGARSIVRNRGGRLVPVPLPGRAATRDLDTPKAWAAFRAETGL
ncbi:nucleotidyltransferase family protein [Wenxinia saemankumensis]|uniref:CTP:molybdopterin cytidylyltransferase MocA n=1 Tax=Wenxinia saemankumensis TaxID=1447782 RepID=A0A1M6A1X5_9RHOB|nr:nucleotidyltransferase family protein [Wenxinia saemankumensis]SHI30445.1 CTP:molybdopterin cytidylyltransferase MocA [Wenxinia saemankumensis]